ncbi:MAG: tetratricopeptide repeat-containing protein, partial [Aliidongia sp.]
GFTGREPGTWNDLALRIAADPALASWDCWTVTYASSWLPDICGIWTADADLGILAQSLVTDLGQGTLARYEALVLIAHSMGGLIVQKSLVDQKQIAARTGTVILFGTPSGGLVKARTLKFWKRQLAGMAQGGEFITKLRADWSHRFAAAAPFSLLAVGGERDQFVPPKSSLEPFPMEQRAVVAGNHVTMIHPPPSDRNVVDLVVQRIAGNRAIGDSALRAIELGDFQTIIEEYLPHAGTLDSSALIHLAIALDGADRRDEAYKLLAEHQAMNSDVMGTLAGRLKRNWLLSGRRLADAEAAEAHYAKGYELAKNEPNLRQAYYHGINLAFLKFVFRKDRKQARRFARDVLEICDRSKALHDADEWLDATKGEAQLILGEAEPALAAYRSFVNAGNDIWKIGSTYLNARTIAADLADRELARKLGALFGDPQP